MPLLVELRANDPQFEKSLNSKQCWQLLYGLHVVLMDYSSATFDPMPINARIVTLPLPPYVISVSRLAEAMALADFAPEQINWREELMVELTDEECGICGQALLAPSLRPLLMDVLKIGLDFLAQCDLQSGNRS